MSKLRLGLIWPFKKMKLRGRWRCHEPMGQGFAVGYLRSLAARLSLCLHTRAFARGAWHAGCGVSGAGAGTLELWGGPAPLPFTLGKGPAGARAVHLAAALGVGGRVAT